MRYPLQTLENPSILQFITGKNVFSIREKTPCFQKISGFSEEKKTRGFQRTRVFKKHVVFKEHVFSKNTWFSKNTCFQKTLGVLRKLAVLKTRYLEHVF